MSGTTGVDPQAIRTQLSQLKEGKDYARVTFNGQAYAVMVLKGNGHEEIAPNFDHAKLETLATSFFEAHQEAFQKAHNKPLDQREISHIDSEGIHLKDKSKQLSTAAKHNDTNRPDFFSEINSQKQSIINDYKDFHSGAKEIKDLPDKYKPFLEKDPTDKEDVLKAIDAYALSLMDDVQKYVNRHSSPRIQEEIISQFQVEKLKTPSNMESRIEEYKNVLKQQITARTTWEAMHHVLLTPKASAPPQPPAQQPVMIPMNSSSSSESPPQVVITPLKPSNRSSQSKPRPAPSFASLDAARLSQQKRPKGKKKNRSHLQPSQTKPKPKSEFENKLKVLQAPLSKDPDPRLTEKDRAQETLNFIEGKEGARVDVARHFFTTKPGLQAVMDPSSLDEAKKNGVEYLKRIIDSPSSSQPPVQRPRSMSSSKSESEKSPQHVPNTLSERIAKLKQPLKDDPSPRMEAKLRGQHTLWYLQGDKKGRADVAQYYYQNSEGLQRLMEGSSDEQAAKNAHNYLNTKHQLALPPRV